MITGSSRRSKGARAWGRSVALGVVGVLLLGVVGGGTSAGDTRAAATPLRLHIGPLGLSVPLGGGNDTITLTATNLSGAMRQVTLKLFDEEGEPIESAQRSVPSGETRSLHALLLPAVQAVRGLVATDGGIWRSSLWVEDGGSDTVFFTDRTVRSGRLLEGSSSSALVPVDAADEVAVNVTNLGQNPATYRLQLVNSTGDVVRSRLLRDVPPRSIRGEEWRDLGVDFVAARIAGSPGTPYQATGQTLSFSTYWDFGPVLP